MNSVLWVNGLWWVNSVLRVNGMLRVNVLCCEWTVCYEWTVRYVWPAMTEWRVTGVRGGVCCRATQGDDHLRDEVGYLQQDALDGEVELPVVLADAALVESEELGRALPTPADLIQVTRQSRPRRYTSHTWQLTTHRRGRRASQAYSQPEVTSFSN